VVHTIWHRLKLRFTEFKETGEILTDKTTDKGDESIKITSRRLLWQISTNRYLKEFIVFRVSYYQINLCYEMQFNSYNHPEITFSVVEMKTVGFYFKKKA
jgi:hypothetical protein